MPDKSNASKPSRDPGAITDYHAHIYYDPAKTRGKAERLRERVAAEFPGAKLGRWHDELVGPHPQSMFQIAFPVADDGGFRALADAQPRRTDHSAASGDRRRLHRPLRARRLVRRRAAAAARRVRQAQVTRRAMVARTIVAASAFAFAFTFAASPSQVQVRHCSSGTWCGPGLGCCKPGMACAPSGGCMKPGYHDCGPKRGLCPPHYHCAPDKGCDPD